jgi:pimeloyl-ACP methyl ester carboxylesterase
MSIWAALGHWCVFCGPKPVALAIDTPILVVDGDHDEAIKRPHTEYIAATIPHAGLLILPNASHFAFLQDPDQFNFAILHFLGDE